MRYRYIVPDCSVLMKLHRPIIIDKLRLLQSVKLLPAHNPFLQSTRFLSVFRLLQGKVFLIQGAIHGLPMEVRLEE